jgi:hypothetical protein
MREFLDCSGMPSISAVAVEGSVGAANHEVVTGRTRGRVRGGRAAFDAASVHVRIVRDGWSARFDAGMETPPVLAAR